MVQFLETRSLLAAPALPTPADPPFQIPAVDNHIYSTTSNSIAVADDGATLTVWTDSSGYLPGETPQAPSYAQWRNPDGTPRSPATLLPAGSSQVQVAGNSAAGFFVAYEKAISIQYTETIIESEFQIYVAAVEFDGTVAAPELAMSVHGIVTIDPENGTEDWSQWQQISLGELSVAEDGSAAIAVKKIFGGSTQTSQAILISARTSSSWSEPTTVVAYATVLDGFIDRASDIDLSLTDSSHAVVVWPRINFTNATYNIDGSIINRDSNGWHAGTPTSLVTGAKGGGPKDVSMQGANTISLAWQLSESVNGPSDIYARQFDANWSPLTSSIQVDVDPTLLGRNGAPRIIPYVDDTAAIVFVSYDPINGSVPNRVYAQLIDFTNEQIVGSAVEVTTVETRIPSGLRQLSVGASGKNLGVLWEPFLPFPNGHQPIYGRSWGADIQTVQASIDETDNGARTFGTYIEGVPQDVTFTVKTGRALSGQKLEYQIDGSVWKPLTATSDPLRYTFTPDVGKLQVGVDTHLLQVRLVDIATGGVLDTYTGQILTTMNLGLSLKGAATGDTLEEFGKLRFLDDVSVPTNIEASLSDLPLFETYKDKFQLVLRKIGGPEVGSPLLFTFTKQAGGIRSPLQFLDSALLDDFLKSSPDYEVVLTARADKAKEFGLDQLRVESVPKWLKDASGKITGTYKIQTQQFHFQTSYPPQLNKFFTDTTENTPFGLFDGLKTELSAGLNFDVYAGLSIDDDAYAEATQLQAKAVLLDKVLVNESVALPGKIRVDTMLDKTTLVTQQIRVETPKYVVATSKELIDVSFGASQQKQLSVNLPQTVLKGLVGPVSSILDLNGSLKASSKTVEAQGTFVLDVSGNIPQFTEGTTVTFFAGATATGKAGAGISLGFPGVTFASAGVKGTVWADIAGVLAIDIRGAVYNPTVDISEKQSSLAAQVGYQLDIDWDVLGYGDKATLIQDYGQPKRILGSGPIEPSLRDDGFITVEGESIVVDTPANPAPNRLPSLTAPESTKLFASAPTVSRLTFESPLDYYATQVQLDFGVESNIATIPANAHHFELLAVPTDSTYPTIRFQDVDLARYPLAPAASGLGFRSAPLRITAPIDGSQFVAGASYRLVLQLTSNPVQGETVVVHPTDIQLSAPDPTLSLTAPGNVLADGVLNFDTEAGGQDYIDLQITNTATPLLLLSDVRVEGAGYGLSPADATQFVYYGDDPRTLRVMVTNPGLAKAGMLRFKTNDPMRPEVVINLTHTPSNVAPVLKVKDFLIGENSVRGAYIGKVSATDADPGQTLTFSISAGNANNAFAIHPSTGVLTVNNSAALDFEKIQQIPLTVRVTDNGNPALSASAPLTVFLRDVNEQPKLKVKDFLIGENSVNGAFIGTIGATDPDAGQTRTFSIVAGNTNNAFAIHPTTGVLTVNNSTALDYEKIKSFPLVIKVVDNGQPALSDTASLTVFLRDANDAPVLKVKDFLIGENSANGAFIGTVSASDQDAGQSKTFSIAAGNIGDAFAIDPVTGVLSVRNSAALDFETNPQFNLTIRVVDNGSPAKSAHAVVRVFLRDVNEAPVVLEQSFGVKTRSGVGTVVGTVAARNPDAGQVLTYAIESGNGLFNNVFEIDSTTGKITVKNSLALLFDRQFDLTIRVTDNGTPALSSVATVHIHVNTAGLVPRTNALEEVKPFKRLAMTSGKTTLTTLTPGSSLPLMT